jgi:hypothetical protein
MPTFALLALLPLLLTLAFAPPAIIHRVEPAPSTRQALPSSELRPLPSRALDAAAEDQSAETPTLAAETRVFPVQRFASLLADVPVVNRLPFVAPAAPAAPSTPAVSAPYTPLLTLLRPPHLVLHDGWPARVMAADLVDRAESLMHVPYVWGGDSPSGLDCSAFVSRVWGVGRHTTETLGQVAFKIDKDELLPGDILNLTVGHDPDGYGHVRLFAGWANAQHSRMWVYEETPPRSLHHVIAYDSRYTPMRRINYEPGDLSGAHLTDLLFGTPAPLAPANAEAEDDEAGDSGANTAAAAAPGPEPAVAVTTDTAGWLAHRLEHPSRVPQPDDDAEWRLDITLAAWNAASPA